VGAIKKIWDSKEFKDFASSKGYGTAWAAQADFATFMAKGDADMGVVMKAAGLAK
jgi:tripartite-type tricarboxylate transporter receptor subunit TctC